MARRSVCPPALVCAVAVLAMACSGGGGGGSAPPTYSVGGTVSGILGTGLVLRNNGGDDLPIPGNGAFTFAHRLADGAAYAVTVYTVPASPPQTCTVTGGSGTIAAASVTGVSVACALSACTTGWGNCDGQDGNGCETDLLTSSAHCGACDTPCAPPHATAACTDGHCQMSSCDAGWFDVDGDVADGCECQYQGGADLPDDGFVDANCDGIDGDAGAAIFVATSGDDANAGTRSAPKKTIGAGLAAAAAAGKTQVYVSVGVYDENVTLRNGISIYGKYDASAGWTRSDAFIVRIQSAAVPGYVVAVNGDSITTPTTVDGIAIRSADATSADDSSYAIRCTGCAALTLRRCTVEAGNGAAGRPGVSGASGASGGAGYGGEGGLCDAKALVHGGPGGFSGCGRVGGAGGSGGQGALDGASGGTGPGGTAGGVGGASGSPGRPGGTGSAGASGASGANGAGGSGGVVPSGFWWVSMTGAMGVNGAAGNGGGGGGGGGGQTGFLVLEGTGNGGGGGGAGGCNGLAGTGGEGGGGSFGVFLVSSTGAVLDQNTISSGTGGNGGAGGAGGARGFGGAPGSGTGICTGEVGAGGNGGRGGDGGAGGHGGGGAGGPSFGVYRVNTSVDVTGNTLSHGVGGAGGTSSGNAGSAGASGDVN